MNKTKYDILPFYSKMDESYVLEILNHLIQASDLSIYKYPNGIPPNDQSHDPLELLNDESFEDAISNSTIKIIFVSKNFVTSVNYLNSIQYTYFSLIVQETQRVQVVLLDSSLQDPSTWDASISTSLGTLLYFNYSFIKDEQEEKNRFEQIKARNTELLDKLNGLYHI
eukprot:snap_masked-scaffold_2-processed-gene-14.28-mRNA-1 protein AED:1.00 eAED:1.00 QI:0/-1/0/0/-1/1/1/0/167